MHKHINLQSLGEILRPLRKAVSVWVWRFEDETLHLMLFSLVSFTPHFIQFVFQNDYCHPSELKQI